MTAAAHHAGTHTASNMHSCKNSFCLRNAVDYRPYSALTCCSHKGLLHEVGLCSCICAEAAELFQLHHRITEQQLLKATICLNWVGIGGTSSAQTLISWAGDLPIDYVHAFQTIGPRCLHQY